MIFKFVQTTNDLREITVATVNYKITNNVLPRLVKEADKLFGNDKWEKVALYGTSFDNLVGWYARQINGHETLEVRI